MGFKNREEFVEVYRKWAEKAGYSIDEEHLKEIFEGMNYISLFILEHPDVVYSQRDDGFNSFYITLDFTTERIEFYNFRFSDIAKGASEMSIDTDGMFPTITFHYTGIIKEHDRLDVSDVKCRNIFFEKGISYEDILDMSLISLKEYVSICRSSAWALHSICAFYSMCGKALNIKEFEIDPMSNRPVITVKFKSKGLDVGRKMIEDFCNLTEDLVFNMYVEFGYIVLEYIGVFF